MPYLCAGKIIKLKGIISMSFLNIHLYLFTADNRVYVSCFANRCMFFYSAVRKDSENCKHFVCR